MKTTPLKITLSLLLLALIGVGCDKNNDSNFVEYPIEIVKELPVLYGGCTLKDGETAVIRDRESLEKVFSKDLISQNAILNGVDFAKCDVLAGCSTFTRGIAGLKHKLTQTGINTWQYKVTVTYNDALPAGNFFYGVVVNKLPAGAKVGVAIERNN